MEAESREEFLCGVGETVGISGRGWAGGWRFLYRDRVVLARGRREVCYRLW